MDQSRKSEGTLLRIKRRRTDEAFNTLYVQQPGAKRPKSDSEGETANLFQFVARVTDEETVDIDTLLLNRDEGKAKEGCTNGTPKSSLPGTIVKKLQNSLQKKRQESPSSNKFRVVPAKRAKLELTSSQTSSEETREAEKDEVSRSVKVYDVLGDSDEKENRPLNDRVQEDESSIVFEEDTITCNSVKMIREKLSLQDKTKREPEYIYDLYFAPNVDLYTVDQMLYIDPLEEQEFYHDLVTGNSEDTYDDEDDSNDENNWRNDYPDEDWGANSDEDYRRRSDSSDGELDPPYGAYRTRSGRMKFDPYYESNEEYDFEAYDEYDES